MSDARGEDPRGEDPRGEDPRGDDAARWAGMFPDPAARRRGPFPAGEAITLPDGSAWALPLALQAPVLGRLRDKLFDQQQLTGQVDLPDVMEAAYVLLNVAYELSQDEIIAVIGAADRQQLADVVLACLLGTDTGHRTYDDWVRSALLANGLDPAAIPPRDLPNVLRQLVRTGRAEEAGTFISSMEASESRRRLLQSLGSAQPAPIDLGAGGDGP